MIKRLVLYSLAGIAVVFLGMQFDRPVRNLSNDHTNHFSTLYPIPDTVRSILTAACYDCHSNYTRYPWYAEFQPVAGVLDDHIRHGKKDLNFSEFALYRPRRQFHKMEEVAELVKDDLMPIADYRKMHPDAVLSEGQKSLLFAWVDASLDSMKHRFHPDSLKARKR
jgi:hypothetical protein